MAWGAIVGPAINAIASAGSAIGSTVASGRHGVKNARFQYKKDLLQWHRQNAYNHPVNQMQRMQEAGLNPNLIYGKGTVGNATSSPSYPERKRNIAEPKFNVMQDMLAHANVQQTKANTDNLRLQSKVIAQTERKLKAETATIGLGNARTLRDWQSANTLLQTSVDASKENLRQLNVKGNILDQTKQDLIDKAGADLDLINEKLNGEGIKNAILQKKKEWQDMGLRETDPWFVKDIRERMRDNPEWTKEMKEMIFKYLGLGKTSRFNLLQKN